MRLSAIRMGWLIGAAWLFALGGCRGLNLHVSEDAVSVSVDMGLFSGDYRGTFRTSFGNDDRVTTRFHADGGGSYDYVTANGRSKSGSLTDCTAPNAVELKCAWREAGGSGWAHFTFQNGYRSFSGNWGYFGKAGNYHWNGSRM